MRGIGWIAALALVGCSNETAVGDWQSTQEVVGQRNTLTAEASGEARATVFIDMMENGQRVAGRFAFEARWFEESTRSEFDMECTRTPFGDCEPDDDFRMDCRLEQEGAALACEGDGRWSDYAFDWSRP